MEGFYALFGVVLGYLISLFVSYKDRKLRKEIASLEIEHKKKIFEIEINQKQELFKLERKDKFRLTALEKRLDAHQQALNQWYYLQSILFEENIEKKNTVIQNAVNFWYKHSIYLENETRKRFIEVIHIINIYDLQLDMIRTEENETQRKEYTEELKDYFQKIKTLPDCIFKEVELEPIIFKDINQDPFGKDKTN